MKNCKRPLIAIVDDDAGVCRAMTRLAWSQGIDSEAFFSGHEFVEALETVPSFQPQCVVLDMNMPGLNGLEVLKHLTRTRPDLPVIFLSACSGDYLRDEANTPAVVAFFRKPLLDDLPIFMNTLRGVVGLDDQTGA